MTVGSDTFSTWSPDWIDPEADAIADAVFGDLARRIGPSPTSLAPPPATSPISRGSSRGFATSHPSLPTPTALPPTDGSRARKAASAIVVNGKPLTAWDTDPAYTAAVRTLLGLPEVGREFPCILPPIAGTEGTAVLWIDSRGCMIYLSKTAGASDAFTLTDLYASLIAGRRMHLDGPNLAVRKLDLMRFLGFLPVPEITLPSLRAGASTEDIKVHKRIGELFAVKAAIDPTDPVAITIGFLADFAPTTWDCARGAINRFEQQGIIVPAGEMIATGRRIRLWKPGTAG